MRRYKVHKIKMPLNRDPNLHNESILVTSEKQIKKYSLGHLVQPEEVPEDDDELTKSFPKPKSSIR